MMGMFIRSQDGKHLVEATSVDLDGAKILVNGEPFAAYEDGDDDEDWDGDDDDDDDFDDEGGDRGFRFLYP